jgi:hypothetical protein
LVFSQLVIKGIVTDTETKKPIKNADVRVIKWDKGDRTDSEGRYEIKLPLEQLSEGDVITLQFNAKAYSHDFEYFYYKTNPTILNMSLKKSENDDRSTQKHTTKIYKIRYRNPEEIFILIEPFLNSYNWAKATVSNDLKTITIKDRADVHTKISTVISEYDIPLKKIWLEVTIIEASENGKERKKITPELEEVITKLSSLFRFDNYEIVSQGDAMGMEGSNLSFSSSFSIDSDKEFSARTKIGYFDNVIKLENFGVTLPRERNDLRTSLNIKNGDTVVVGSSRGKAQDGSFITIVTAKVVQEE